MPIDTDLNISPYYDDYDENKDFHRVLFRPAVPLQARELTQLQTILQQQIERFGQFQFKEGTIIKGCTFTFDPTVKYAKLFDKTSTGTDVNVSLFATNDYARTSSNLVAQIVDTRSGLESQNPFLNTLFFKYINTGTGSETSYANGDVLEIYPNATAIANVTITANGAGYSNSDTVSFSSSLKGVGAAGNVVTHASNGSIKSITITANGAGYSIADYPTIAVTSANASAAGFLGTVGLIKTANVTVANSNFGTGIGAGNTQFQPVGTAYQMKVEDGIIFQKGNFQRFAAQDIIVSPYTKRPHEVSVGVVTTEAVVNSSIDTTLLDNASGYSNENAPGADRLSLTPKLTVNTTAIVEASNNFLQLVKFQNGQKVSMNQEPVLGDMSDELATRTYEESGDYVVDPFVISTEELVGNTTHLSAVVGAGIGYVKGRRFQTVGPTRVPIKKADTSVVATNQSVSVNYGQYIKIDETMGHFGAENNDQILILDTAHNLLSAGAGVAILPAQSSNTVNVNGVTSNVIGTARIRKLEQESDGEGQASSKYNLYLYDVRMYTGKSFNKHAKAVYHYASTEHPAGNSNIAQRGLGDISGTAKIFDPSFSSLVFKLGQTGIKNVGTASYVSSKAQDVTIQADGTVGISLTGTETFGYGTADATLNETQEKELVLVSRAAQNATSAADTTSVVTGTSNVISSSTTSTLSAGDFVYVGSNVRQITNILSTTSFQVDNTLTAATGLTVLKTFPKDTVIPLAGSATAAVTSTGQTLTINLDQILNGTLNARLSYNVKDSAEAGLKKTVTTSYVKIDCSSNGGTTLGPWNLGIPDGLLIDKVYVHTSYSEASAYDKTSQFELDNGQQDGYYGLSKLKLKPNSNLALVSGNKIVVKLKHFVKDTSAGVGFYTYQSYDAITDDAAPAANEITTQEIPVFVSPRTGDEFSLRDCVDFRPNVSNTATQSATVGSATINPASTETIIGTNNLAATPNQIWTADVTYYLPRKDRLVIDRNGFNVIKGIPSTKPEYSAKPELAMQLATIDIPVYPSLDTVSARYYKRPGLGTKVRATQLKRYSMSDIKKMDKRIDNLEYYSSLNMLEKQATDITLPGRTNAALNRFKNGFLVDNFSSRTTGNPLNSEFKAGYDTARNMLSPKWELYSLKLKQESGSRTATKGDMTLIDYAQRQIITQPLATQTRKCTSAFWEYNGTLSLYPDYLADVDHTKAAESAVQIDIDVASPTLALIDELNKMSPAQLTSDEVISESITTSLSGSSSSDTVRTDTFTTIKTQQIERSTTSFSGSAATTTKNVGDFVTDISFQPYIPSVEIRFVATGLRPNLVHHVYFDDVAMGSDTAPATLTSPPGNVTSENASSVIFRTKAFGAELKAGADGKLAGILRIPGGTFFAGERKVVIADIEFLSQIGDMVSHATSRFNCFNFSVESGSLNVSTRTPVLTSSTSKRIIGSTETTTTQTNTTIPANNTPEANTSPPSTGDDDGANNVTVVGNTVTVTPDPSANVVLPPPGNTSPVTLPRPRVEEPCWEMQSERSWWGGEGGMRGWWEPEFGCAEDDEDPLCQTFMIDKNSFPQKVNTGYLTRLDLFFASKDPTQGCIVELRTVQGGTPQSKVLPFSRVELDASQVNTSTNGTVATAVEFKSPVMVSSSMEYAIVIKPNGNSPEYSVFTSKAGMNELSNSAKQVNQDWGKGTMFLSTNDRTWTAYIDEDMKFNVYAAVFKHTEGQVQLVNRDYEWLTANNLTINGSFVGQEEVFKLAANAAGTIAFSQGNSTVVGTSTTFADLGIASGDRIVLTGSTSTFDVVTVASVENNTRLTLKGAPTFTKSGGSYMVTPTATFDRLDANTTTVVLADSSAASNSFKFANGDTIIGCSSVANCQIGEVVDTNISYFEPQLYRNDPSGTTITPRIQGIDTVSGSLSATELFKYNDRNYPTESIKVMSKSNEIANNSGAKSLRVIQTLSTSKIGMSPSIDLQSQGLSIYENIINNVETNEYKAGGSAAAKYVSRTLTLAEDLDAEDIKVFVNAWRPVRTDVSVYAKILNSADSDNFEDKAWSKLVSRGPNQSKFSSSQDRDSIVEYEYGFKATPDTTVLSGQAITTLNSTAVTGSGTDFQTDFNDGDLIKIVASDPETDYFITTVVGEPASATALTVSEKVPFDSVGTIYAKVNASDINQAFQDRYAPDNFEVSYYNSSNEKFLGYQQLAIKIVMTSSSTNVAPRINDYRALAVSL
jgi:hypothetical protein